MQIILIIIKIFQNTVNRKSSHKDTFQPDMGIRICILFITKPKEGKRISDDYKIFMAQSQRIAQDSKRNPIFILDGNSTDILSYNLSEIANACCDFRERKEYKEFKFIFSIYKNKIKDHCNINPQHYSPKLNEVLNKALDIKLSFGRRLQINYFKY